MGICNLATIYDNKGFSFIISGSAYQNALYYYNKKIAYFKSILDMQRGTTKCSSKRLKKLYSKRKRVITNIIHKSTKMIVDYCDNNDITRVIIGDIINIRKDNNLGHENNQKLHFPFLLSLYSFTPLLYNKIDIISTIKRISPLLRGLIYYFILIRTKNNIGNVIIADKSLRKLTIP